MALLISDLGTLSASMQETLDGEEFFHASYLNALQRDEEEASEALWIDVEFMKEVHEHYRKQAQLEKEWPRLGA